MKGLHIYSEFNSILDKNLTVEHKAKVQEIMSLAMPLLGFLPRTAPNLTDHGVRHSNNLMEIFDNFSQNLEKLGFTLSKQENYLLIIGIWLHDVGLLITDEKDKDGKHNINSIKVLESKAFSMLCEILGKDVFKCLKYVVKYHTSRTNLEEVPQHEIIPNVRLRLICAIFRLIDSCDITSARTSGVLYNVLTENGLLKDDSLPHWKAHLSIVSAVFQQRALVVDCDNKSDGELHTTHLKNDLEAINKIFKAEKFPEFQLAVIQSDFS